MYVCVFEGETSAVAHDVVICLVCVLRQCLVRATRSGNEIGTVFCRSTTCLRCVMAVVVVGDVMILYL